MNWTKELPKESGFYWYICDEESEPQVIEWDVDMGAVRKTDTEIMLWRDATENYLPGIKGEFWPEKLVAPMK